MSRSSAAFLIALLFHLLLLALFWIAVQQLALTPKSPPKEPQRIKVSLKEQPKAAKESFEHKPVAPSPIAPPLPKGKQLKEVSKEHFVAPPKEPIPTQPINQDQERAEPKAPKTAPLPPKEKQLPLPSTPKKEPSLYDRLSKPSPKEQEQPKQTARESRISGDVKELYGDEFGKLSEGEQKYILDNQEIMRRITQEVLNRVGSVNIPQNLRVNRHNIVEFYLHPNGDISDLKFIERSGFYILDETTKETIEYAYSRYPRPSQKTLIRYRVGYYLQGY
ncbi:MAG: hypothetical protein JXK05_10870 [Campylobacterales bacterium]|nr:hypothetical protein [Campylobacterales bacterium]